jgi:hypothetical protein
MKKQSHRSAGLFSARVFVAFNLFCAAGLLGVSALEVTSNLDGAKERDAEYEAPQHDMPVPGGDPDDLNRLELQWHDRLTYPTGRFDPAWVRQAAEQDAQVSRSIPAGLPRGLLTNTPLSLNPNAFTALGPAPEQMTGCSGCFNFGTTEGRVNAIAVDPTTTTTGSIVAYLGTDGGGVWKTTNCCSVSTSWSVLTDGAAISTTAIDTLTIDPNNHNTIYAGTGDLNFGSFSQGSQGILKSTDGGASWVVLAPNVFGAALPEPVGQYPQYQAVGKVRVDPNNSNNVVAGAKTGLYFSYDGGTNWTGPCTTNAFNTQRQDITGLELTNVGGITRILAAVGVRGFATTVQYNLDQNGANGLYKGSMPASGCPSDFTLITRNDNGFVFGTAVTGSAYSTGANMNAGSGTPYGGVGTGTQLGRMDIAVAPSNPNVIYAQVGSIAANSNSGCGSTSGCQLGLWSSIDGGTTWSFMAGSAGGALRNCSNGQGDYPQNWYDQGMAVDPNNPDRLFVDTFDVWFATRTGTSFYDLTCGYSGGSVVHVDQHALAFVPGSSSILLKGSDGGVFSSSNANVAVSGTRNTWVNMDNGVNTIEFYAGDISGNFATAASPVAVGGAQDNGPSSVTFSGTPTGPVLWQEGLGGDGFSGQIDPIGTGTSLRIWEGNNSGGLSRCTSNCTAQNATWTSSRGSWTGDQQSFVLPINLFHGGIAGGDDCAPASPTTGCGHLVAGTTRVWETILGAAASVTTSSWYTTTAASCTGTNACLTKGTLGNRSYINQVKYSPKYQSVAIVGTNDGNVQIGFNLGTGVAAQANWVNVTGSNAVLPNRPVLGIALDPIVATSDVPVGYAAVGGFNANTPTTPGHLFQVVCTSNCGSFTWADKTGNLPDIPVDSVIVNPNFHQQVFAGTDFGLYYTDDITAASPVWNRFQNGLPNTMIWDMQIDRGATTLSVWTRSRGAFVWPLPTGAIGGGTPTPTATATATSTPTATATSTPTATATSTPTATATATATPVTSPTPTATATATASATATATPVTSPTPTATATATASPTATATATASPASSPTPTATATATPTAVPAQALNLSSRLRVETGDKLMIGGFIISGNTPKKVIIRGMGPFLSSFGITDFLHDPYLELRSSNNTLLQSNDNWKDTQQAEIQNSGLAPNDDREAVIITTLTPGTYTALLTGKGGTTGVGLVEVYDANPTADSQLSNLSTRGFVQGGNDVLIAGYVLGGSNTGNDRIAIRGLGPSLAQFGLNPVLADPTLELHDENGNTLITNDDWATDPVSAANLIANNLAPSNPKEAAIFTSLPPGTFTAILAGKNGGTGIGIVEVYNLK